MPMPLNISKIARIYRPDRSIVAFGLTDARRATYRSDKIRKDRGEWRSEHGTRPSSSEPRRFRVPRRRHSKETFWFEERGSSFASRGLVVVIASLRCTHPSEWRHCIAYTRGTRADTRARTRCTTSRERSTTARTWILSSFFFRVLQFLKFTREFRRAPFCRSNFGYFQKFAAT